MCLVTELEAGAPQQLRAFLLLWVLSGAGGPGLLLLGSHGDHEVYYTVAIPDFIVIPGNEFDKVVVEDNARPSIKGGRVGITF